MALRSTTPAGVYHGEEAKLVDWNEHLPEFRRLQLVAPGGGGRPSHRHPGRGMAHGLLHLPDLRPSLGQRGLRDKAIILWNANNVMGFDRIDWRRLDFCSQITTVSRYMKHVMWDSGRQPPRHPQRHPRRPDRSRPTRRWWPDCAPPSPTGNSSSRSAASAPTSAGTWPWNALAEEKRRGTRRRHGHPRRNGATRPGGPRQRPRTGPVCGRRRTYPEIPGEAHRSLWPTAPRADIYNVSQLHERRVDLAFYSGADAVLANSGHEPFGLVGLEVMAAGGVAFVGSTGEDYAVPFLNSVVLDTDDPAEINIALDFLRTHPEVVVSHALRRPRDGPELQLGERHLRQPAGQAGVCGPAPAGDSTAAEPTSRVRRPGGPRRLNRHGPHRRLPEVAQSPSRLDGETPGCPRPSAGASAATAQSPMIARGRVPAGKAGVPAPKTSRPRKPRKT